jgi:SAM-dependent methyltransferase
MATTQPSEDARRFSAAAERNRDPILAVLRRHVPATGLVLEIASGSGQHVVHFAAALPALEWQPSDPDASAHASIAAWKAHTGLTNVRAPIALDVRHRPWPVARADAVVAINKIHIAPWEAALALFAGAATVLPDGGIVFLYGPYRRHGAHTAPSNARFDAQLRAQDPAWGVRDLEAVVEAARAEELTLAEVADMPANNFSVVLRKTSRVGSSTG